MKPPAPTPHPPLLNRLSQYFFRGLITFLPLAITVYVLVLFITWTERTYHRRRRQARLGRLTPIEYEMIMTPQTATAA